MQDIEIFETYNGYGQYTGRYRAHLANNGEYLATVALPGRGGAVTRKAAADARRRLIAGEPLNVEILDRAGIY